MSDENTPAAGKPAFSTEGFSLDEIAAFPATFVNRVLFTGMGPNVRLALCDQANPSGKTHVRSVVVMTVLDALQLRDLLSHMLADVQMSEVERAEPNA